MKEMKWRGVVTMLDTSTSKGQALGEALVSWTRLPITVWSDFKPAGLIKSIWLEPDRVSASGVISDGALMGRLVTGKPIPVEPVVVATDRVQKITGLIVVSRSVWLGAEIWMAESRQQH